MSLMSLGAPAPVVSPKNPSAQVVITGERYRTRATRQRTADKKACNEARAAG